MTCHVCYYVVKIHSSEFVRRVFMLYMGLGRKSINILAIRPVGPLAESTEL